LKTLKISWHTGSAWARRTFSH